jgi:NAD(P)-dependent dehydrogenase (short-subunit alcohol dehydrogenase family)
MEIAGRAFLVAGGGSGLGAATAWMLEDAGGRVVVGDLQRREEIGRFVEADVCDDAAVQHAVDAARELGELSGAVNCAGIGGAGLVVERRGHCLWMRFAAWSRSTSSAPSTCCGSRRRR